MASPTKFPGGNPKPIPVSAGYVTSNNTIAKVDGQPSPKYHHIWLVTGPAGCGKSTVAEHIAQKLNMPYLEGDNVCFIELFPPQIDILHCTPIFPFLPSHMTLVRGETKKGRRERRGGSACAKRKKGQTKN